MGNPNIRKSCSACRKAKIKCNSILPCCSRCIEKNLVCFYEETARSRKVSTSENGRGDHGDVNGNLENETKSSISISLDSQPVPNPKPVLSSFSYPNPDSFEFLLPNDISLDWDMNTGLGTEDPSTSSTTDDTGPKTPNDFETVDTNLQLENCNFEYSYDSNFGPIYSTGFDNSIEICTIGFNTTEGPMFNTPYLIFQYTNPFSQIPSNASALLVRQSPFTETQDSRLGGNPLGRFMLLENIRSYLVIFSPPNSFPPYIHHSTFEVTSTQRSSEVVNWEVEGGRSKSESINICCNIAMLYINNTEQISASLWEDISKERERMNEAVSSEVLLYNKYLLK